MSLPPLGPSPSGTIITSTAKPRVFLQSSRNLWIILGAALSVILILGGVGIYIRLHAPKQPAVLHSTDDTANYSPADRTADNLDQEHKKANAKGYLPSANSSSSTSPADQNKVPIPPGAAIPPSPYAQPVALTPEQRAYQAEQDAMSTPLDQPAPQLQSQATTMAQPSSPTTPDLQTLIEGLVHPNVVAPLEKKEDAKKEELPPDAVSPYHRLPPAGKYMLVAGDSIPCRLDQTVVSELPGKIYCTVDLDVRDSEENLLIPHGTRLQGSYQNRLAYGDSRLLQLWDRLIFPDKSSINLLLEVGTDPDGSTGLSGSLNRHYARMISNALLATVFAAGIAVTQRTNTSLIATPSVGNVVGQAAGAQIGQLVSEMGRQDIARSATFRLDPGALIHVPIGHDMVFDSPYTSYVTATANVLSDAR